MPIRFPVSNRLARLVLACLMMLSALAGVAPSPAAAQPCIGDEEPNDAETDVQPVPGRFCLVGSLPADDQDLLLWEVDGEAAGGPVSISLTGVPTTVTTARRPALTSEPAVEPVVVGT